MRLFARLFRLVWGAEVDRALRPVLAVGLAGSLSFSAGWSFMGIWAIDELGAESSQLGVAFLAGACLAAASGYLGGHLSDHVGRRPVILVGWGGMAAYMLLFVTAGHNVVLGLALLAGAAVPGALGGSVTQAMVADLVPPERHEAAYAAVRVANNLGVTAGPPLGAFFLVAGDWTALFAMLLMGLPFLLLSATSALPVVALVIFVFVIGEMLWVPTSQTVIARLAPEDVRGAYMGAFGSGAAVGFALAPFLGLQVRDAYGDDVMWGAFAGISVVAAIAGALACRWALRRPDALEPAAQGVAA
ncbi:MAG: MFS transporter [Gaiellaceae bacterium]